MAHVICNRQQNQDAKKRQEAEAFPTMLVACADLDGPPIPEMKPLPQADLGSQSSISMSIVEGPTLNLWFNGTVTEGKTKGELTVQLQPDEAVVIGRQEGGEVPYLDTRYQPTQMLPNSSARVVTSMRHGTDLSVSRGHFTLKGSAQGILLVNGVPQRGGGIRPPKNGTELLEPAPHMMGQGEEHLIERGAAAKIRLPNRTVILIRAE